MKILVVDDDSFIAEMVKTMLESEGFKIKTASCVDDAIVALNAANDFNLVITDIVMPEKDGTKLMQHIKGGKNPLPILAMTAGVENAVSDYLNYAEMFADEVLAKPFKKDKLIEIVKRLAA